MDDDKYKWPADGSKELILSAIEDGKLYDIRGYDGEGIIDMSCCHGAEFLDKVLTLLTEKGYDVNGLSHNGDSDGYCSVQLFRGNAPIMEVFRKHGVSTDYERLCPLPWSDVYTLYVERRMIERMEQTARKWHEGQFRKDGVTPYVEHPKKVAKMVLSWFFQPDSDGWAAAVAWAHDLFEETPKEKHAELEKDILYAARGLLHEENTVLAAIKLLSRDESEFPNKDDYIKHVAETADLPTLVVKIADRICNTRDFLELEGAGKEKATQYFALGEPLFAALDRFTDSRIEKIRLEIDSVRAILEQD